MSRKQSVGLTIDTGSKPLETPLHMLLFPREKPNIQSVRSLRGEIKRSRSKFCSPSGSLPGMIEIQGIEAITSRNKKIHNNHSIMKTMDSKPRNMSSLMGNVNMGMGSMPSISNHITQANEIIHDSPYNKPAGFGLEHSGSKKNSIILPML